MILVLYSDFFGCFFSIFCISFFIKFVAKTINYNIMRLFFFFFYIILFSSVYSQNLYFKHLGIKDGLSQVCIPSIYQDKNGVMWIGTTEGLNRYNGVRIQDYTSETQLNKYINNTVDKITGNGDSLLYIVSKGALIKMNSVTGSAKYLKKKGVKSIFCRNDTVWIACDDGVYYYTDEGEKCHNFLTQESDLYQFSEIVVFNNKVYAISSSELYVIDKYDSSVCTELLSFPQNDAKVLFVDSRENIWVGTWSGVYMISDQDKINHFTTSSNNGNISHNQIRCIVEDNIGNVWLGTFKGLDRYDLSTKVWQHYTDYGDSPNTLSHASVLSLYKDLDGNIWAGTYFGGVNIFSPDPKANFFYHAQHLRNDWLSFPVVSKMEKDSDGNIWICTEGGGLNILNKNTGEFKVFKGTQSDTSGLLSANLKCIFYNKNNNKMYIGTHFGGMYVYDLNKKAGYSLVNSKMNPNSLPHDIVNEIQPYDNGFIVLTPGGVVFMDPKTDSFKELNLTPEVKKILKREFCYETLRIDSRNRLWLGHIKGGVTCVNLSNSQHTYYELDSLHQSCVSSIFEDEKGEIYVTTMGSGMHHFINHKNVFKSYTPSNDSFPNSYCYYVCSAGNNMLYIIHGGGISLFDSMSEKVLNTYGLFNQSYSMGSSILRSDDGLLYIGGTNGLAVVDEKRLLGEIVLRNIEFDRLFVYNKEIRACDETGILSDILSRTDLISLKYNQNNISLEFTNYDYLNNIVHPFEYNLKGFDSGWNIVEGNRITYTSLPPGEYTLNIRPYIVNHNTNVPVKSIKIIVKPPFYLSIVAYIFYSIIAIFIVFMIVKFIIRQASLRASLVFERAEKDRIEELNRSKINFFTNISHEFKTPLTLILGQLESIINSDLNNSSLHNKLQRVYKNAWNLKNLVTELLDFHKQEEGFLKLKVEERDMVSFVKQVTSNFIDFAKQREVSFHVTSLIEEIMVYFDPLQMHKVISNLVLNAFKFTPSGGEINVYIRKSNSDVQIIISDTGVGIPKDEIGNIFNQFYQIDRNKKHSSLGTGIGLSIAKNIIELHHGDLSVNSEIDKGTEFVITLRLGHSHFSEEELSDSNKLSPVIVPDLSSSLMYGIADEVDCNDKEVSVDDFCTGNSDKPIMLIVEDNDELCSILSDVLSPTYNINIVHDGAVALDVVKKIHPDIVLSDVMIPNLSGKDLCYKIKNNVELSDISIVLMTGMISTDLMLEALMAGADDYIIKPFDIRLLQSRCRNILKNKKRLIAWCGSNIVPETTGADAVSDSDRKLLEKCIEVIKDNFDNPDFDVTVLANKMCMGRSKLYTKFKQIAGIPPNEFIIKIKLEEAMLLLKENPEFNVSEISIKLGFSSPRYFSKLFKAFFGVTPQSVRRNNE